MKSNSNGLAHGEGWTLHTHVPRLQGRLQVPWAPLGLPQGGLCKEMTNLDTAGCLMEFLEAVSARR